MKKRRSVKLTLNRETLKQLDRSSLQTLAGGDTAGVACVNTYNGTCKGTCQTCGGLTCFTICAGCTTETR
jgi:hypothetical protein